MNGTSLTLAELQIKLQPIKPIAERTLRRYLDALRIKPLGDKRQRPRRYPIVAVKKLTRFIGV